MAIQCACGSYADPDYAGLLYPKGLAPELRLSAYAMWFDHLELNASYYAVPKAASVQKWIATTPPSFFFDVRLHRVISQSPAKSAQEGRLLNYFLEGVRPLIEAKKLGAFLHALHFLRLALLDGGHLHGSRLFLTPRRFDGIHDHGHREIYAH